MTAIPFRPFTGKNQQVHITRSKLPHWSCANLTHFVTFRLLDSLPQKALASWLKKRNTWFQLRGIAPNEPNFFSLLSPEHRREYRQLFGKAFEEQLDRGHGSCLLRQKENATLVALALHHFDGKRYSLGDFVIMPNHVHVLVTPFEGFHLNQITKSWKGYSARVINQRLNQKGNLWQRESFDHLVRHRRQLERLISYISENPTTAKLCSSEFIHFQAEWAFPTQRSPSKSPE